MTVNWVKNYQQVEQKVDVILEQLHSRAANISTEQKRAMFMQAVDIAISDRELHDSEISLLLRIKDALRCTSKEYKNLNTKEDIVNLVRQRRRTYQS